MDKHNEKEREGGGGRRAENPLNLRDNARFADGKVSIGATVALLSRASEVTKR